MPRSPSDRTIRAVMRHLSNLGAAAGGRARAAALTPEQRSEAARKAAQARWANVRSHHIDESCVEIIGKSQKNEPTNGS